MYNTWYKNKFKKFKKKLLCTIDLVCAQTCPPTLVLAHSCPSVLILTHSCLFLLFCLQVSGKLSGTTGGDDGGRWLDDADILLVVAEWFVHKLEWEGGIGAHAPWYSFTKTKLLQLSFGRANL